MGRELYDYGVLGPWEIAIERGNGARSIVVPSRELDITI